MNLGQRTYGDLNIDSFRMAEIEQSFLSGLPYSTPKIYIGLPKWGRKEWVGKLYPNGTKDSQFLNEYVNHFNCIELNATHYKVASPESIEKWANKANGKDFKFCPKVPKLISHYSGFIKVEKITNEFLEGVRAIKENLGPIFLQLSENYVPAEKENLFRYLETLPKDLQFFLEVRHPDWFAGSIVKKELFDTLQALKIGAIITDTPGRRDVVHMHLTIPKTFIRFSCEGDHETDYSRIEAWKERLKYWYSQGLQECYFIIHAQKEEIAPEFAKYVQDQFKNINLEGTVINN